MNRNKLTVICLLWLCMAAVVSAESYTCPMHPHYIASEMGSCPICGMDLVTMPEPDITPEIPAITHPAMDSSTSKQYTCPMHPHYIADEMGTCPICGMDLVEMKSKSPETTNNSAQEQERTVITIAAETIQNMGVRIEKVALGKFGKNIRSVGQVVEDERARSVISSRVEGWVEHLSVNAIGDKVTKGQKVFTLYSPELIAAQRDYLAAIKSKNLRRVTVNEKRLKLLGMQQKALDLVKRRQDIITEVPFYANSDGLISHLNIEEGDYLKPGASVATIQNYDNVWVEANVAEKDLRFIGVGGSATIAFTNLGIDPIEANVDFIYPTLDRMSRTGRVRFVIANPDGNFYPGAYADINFQTSVSEKLSVPSEAILNNSEGSHVVAALGNGRFQPVAVKTGLIGSSRTEILSGLEVDQDIVVSGQFLIDSESALRESFTKLQLSQKPLSEINLSHDQQAMLDHYIDAALYLHDAFTTPFEPQQRMIQPAIDLREFLIPALKGTKLEFIIHDAHKALKQLAGADTQEAEKEVLASLVSALLPWIQNGKPTYYKQKGVKVFVEHPSNKHWLGLKANSKNPYANGHVQEVPLVAPTAMSASSEGETSDMPVMPMMGGSHAHH